MFPHARKFLRSYFYFQFWHTSLANTAHGTGPERLVGPCSSRIRLTIGNSGHPQLRIPGIHPFRIPTQMFANQYTHTRVFFFALSLQLLADVLDYRGPFSGITYSECFPRRKTQTIKGKLCLRRRASRVCRDDFPCIRRIWIYGRNYTGRITSGCM